MKIFVMTFLILNIYLSSAQTKVDTLVIGNFKLSLKHSETFYDVSQREPVILPSEYEREEDEVVSNFSDSLVSYNFHDTSVSANYYDSLEYIIIQDFASIITGVRTIDSNKYRELKISKNCDTIELKKTTNIIPFIKVKDKQYFLCGIEMYRIRNNTLTKYNIQATSDPLELDFSPELVFSPENYKSTKTDISNDVFILTGLYYRKGDTTYYLDRTLLLKKE